MHQGSFGLPVDEIKHKVKTTWPLFVKRIRQEAAKPLEGRITDLEGQCRWENEQVDNVMAKNHHLYKDVQNLKDDLDEECKSLREKVEGNPPCRESNRV
jgi:hypothetical protein